MNRNSTARLVIPVLNLILQILSYESSIMSHTEDMVDPLLPLFPSEQTENLSMSIFDTIKFSKFSFFSNWAILPVIMQWPIYVGTDIVFGLAL